MTDTKPIRRIAIIGTGVIGASWSSLFLAKGLQVVATDPAPNAEAALRKFVETAWPALKRLGLSPGASQSNLTFTADITQALAGADRVQENGPERIDFKQKTAYEIRPCDWSSDVCSSDLPPRGNTVNRASIDNKPAEPEIVVTHLMEGIGIALDIPNNRMFVTDFAGSVYSADLDGKNERNFLYAQGNLTGIAYAEI